MSELTPVTNSAIVIDRGSMSSAALTWSPPTGIQVNRVWMNDRCGTARARSPA